jgi:hypothetical protein
LWSVFPVTKTSCLLPSTKPGPATKRPIVLQFLMQRSKKNKTHGQMANVRRTHFMFEMVSSIEQICKEIQFS